MPVAHIRFQLRSGIAVGLLAQSVFVGHAVAQATRPKDACGSAIRVAYRDSQGHLANKTVWVTRRDVINAQLERNYVTFKGGLGNIPIELLEANIAAHFVLAELPVGNATTNLTFKTNFRFLQGNSAPIRTPTYSPQVTVYVPRGASCDFLVVGIRHYSNGQEHEAVINGEINYVDGNFSTNYSEVGYVFTKVGPSAYTFFKPSVELHVAQDSLEQKDYGQVRLHAQFMQMYSQPASNGLSNGSFVQADVFAYTRHWPLSQALALSLTFDWKPSILEDFGLFVNAWWGRDYYNIWFERNLSVLRVGLMGDNLHFTFR